MKEQLLKCMKKMKEIQFLAVESINKMQVICKSLRLARYEQDMKAMGAPQNQIIPPSDNSSMQQLLNWVKSSFVAPKSLPPLWMLSHKILLAQKVMFYVRSNLERRKLEYYVVFM